MFTSLVKGSLMVVGAYYGSRAVVSKVSPKTDKKIDLTLQTAGYAVKQDFRARKIDSIKLYPAVVKDIWTK